MGEQRAEAVLAADGTDGEQAGDFVERQGHLFPVLVVMAAFLCHSTLTAFVFMALSGLDFVAASVAQGGTPGRIDLILQASGPGLPALLLLAICPLLAAGASAAFRQDILADRDFLDLLPSTEAFAAFVAASSVGLAVAVPLLPDASSLLGNAWAAAASLAVGGGIAAFLVPGLLAGRWASRRSKRAIPALAAAAPETPPSSGPAGKRGHSPYLPLLALLPSLAITLVAVLREPSVAAAPLAVAVPAWAWAAASALGAVGTVLVVRRIPGD